MDNKTLVKQYLGIVQKIAKIEHRRIPNHMIEYEELVSIGVLAIQSLIKGKTDEQLAHYNDAYIGTAVKWAIRNEVRRRYKWYSQKTKQDISALPEDAETMHDDIREAVYKTILSIDEMAEAENPTQIKDTAKTPAELADFHEMSTAIKEAMKKLPQRERDLIEAKFFHDKKLRELSEDFNISPSRISRIIQSGLNKIRKELEKNHLA